MESQLSQSYFKLLTRGNPKTMKGQKLGYQTFILHLAPAAISGFEMCPNRTPGCTALCLNTAGRGGIIKHGETTNSIQQSRIRKAQEFMTERGGFLALLIEDMEKAVNYARRPPKHSKRKRAVPCFRLNGTSDIAWHQIPVTRGGVEYPSVFDAFPDVQFYDYTKAPYAARRHDIANYAMTFSHAETIKNHLDGKVWADHGANIAVVFNVRKVSEFPATFNGRRVINGDDSDLRFTDPRGVVVALKAKGGRARKSPNAFLVSVEGGK